MDEEGNLGSAPKAGPPEPGPKITLFGKQMEMSDDADSQAGIPGPYGTPPRGYDPEGERRTFWLVIGTFAAVFLIAFLAARLLLHRRASRPPVAAPAVAQPTEKERPASRPSPPAALPAPQPTAPAATPPVRAAQPATRRHSSRPSATAAAGARVARPAGAGPPAKTAPKADTAYIQRLREQMKQYDREKAQGKYQEFPK